MEGSVLLVQGWNAFGVPANVPLGQLKVVVGDALYLYSLSDAASQNIITIYSFDNNQYNSVPVSDGNFVLQAGKGYLLYAEQSGKLLFAPCNDGERVCRENNVAVCTAGEYVLQSCPSPQVCDDTTRTCQSPFAQACSSHVGDVVSFAGKDYVLKKIGGGYSVPLSSLHYGGYSLSSDPLDFIQYSSQQEIKHIQIPIGSFKAVEGYTDSEQNEYVTAQIDRSAGILACSQTGLYFLTQEFSDATTFSPYCSSDVDTIQFNGHTYQYGDFRGTMNNVWHSDSNLFIIPGSNDREGYSVFSYGEGQPTNYMVLKLRNAQTYNEIKTISVARGLPKEEGGILILPCDFFVKFFVKIG